MNTYLRLITTSYHFATLLNERSLSKTSLWRCCVILKLFLDAVNGKFLASKEAFDYIYLSLNDDSNNIEFPFCELSRNALILVRTPIAHQHQHDTRYTIPHHSHFQFSIDDHFLQFLPVFNGSCWVYYPIMLSANWHQ